MAIRQYVGARYVPRFMGNYDATQIYDALDVVDNGIGTSYIARKTVPAGTALTNTEYWFVYGAASGAILDLEDRMTAAEGDIDTLETDVAHLASSRMIRPENRNFLFFADSYDVQTDYIDTVADWINCASFIKRSKTSGCFYKTDNTKTWYYIITEENTLSAAEKASITDVAFCVAGGNDVPSVETDLSNAMVQMNTWLRANIPNLRNIYLFPVGWATMDQSMQSRIKQNWTTYSRISTYCGWKYVNCSTPMRTSAYIEPTDSQNYHPTSAGGVQMAYAVAEAIINGCSVRELYRPAIQLKYDITLPESWGSPTISDPSNGIVTFNVTYDKAGKIVATCTTYPLSINGISKPASSSFQDIILTPVSTAANHDVFPVGYMKPVQVYDDANDSWGCAFINKSVNGSVAIRLKPRTAAAASNDQVRLVIPPLEIDLETRS